MSPNITLSTQAAQQQAVASDSGFDLDVTLLEVADPAGLVNVTDDGCGSTCGACTTGVA
ncbi:FxLD family lanthipeptide [Actinacidiphila sp. bgisy167]|uniref:FxLD family lanthipeptide n=1 Tax=Actinacidiphila sp. bgisy167 TaxID=3413797 RepID=UPI003D75E0F9